MTIAWRPLDVTCPVGAYRVDASARRFGFEEPADLAAFRRELNRTFHRALVRAADVEQLLQQAVLAAFDWFEWRTRGLPPEHVQLTPRGSSSWFAAFFSAAWRD